MFKEDTKKVLYNQSPFNFDDKSYIKTIYESPNLVKSVHFQEEYGGSKFIYVVDEAKFVKETLLDISGEKPLNKLVTQHEYFVSSRFVGNEKFCVHKEMLFEGDTGYKLKVRGTENEAFNNIVDSTIPEIMKDRCFISPD